ncbi:radical SAM protein [Sphingomonas sp. MMS24-JH45]
MAVIDTVVKVRTSRCNLDCSYCYVFDVGDEGWRRQPKRLGAEVEAAVVQRIGELLRDQGRPLSIVLHGGEPLLPRYREAGCAVRIASRGGAGLRPPRPDQRHSPL